MELLAHLTDALERLGDRDRAVPHAASKAPNFNGVGDVECSLNQLTKVAEANRWDEATTLIHLRDDARECGRSLALRGVEDQLQEARAKLALLKQANKTTL